MPLNEEDKLELQRLKEIDGLRHFMWPITPINLEEEEERFFKSDFKVNPQFIYHKPKLALNALQCFKRPVGTLLHLAIKILNAFLKVYGTESNFLNTGGEILNLAKIKESFQKYIDNLELGPYLNLDFSYNTVSPTTITHNPKTNQSTMTIGLPSEYREHRIEGVLNHEIGTNFIRNHNEQFQGWFKGRYKNKKKNYLNTEEGLA